MGAGRLNAICYYDNRLLYTHFMVCALSGCFIQKKKRGCKEKGYPLLCFLYCLVYIDNIPDRKNNGLEKRANVTVCCRGTG